MALSAKAKEFAVKAELPPDAEAWFIKTKIVEVNDIALMAQKEELVQDNITSVMAGESVSSATKIGEKIGILKFWILCRESYEDGKKPRSETIGIPDAAMPEDESKTIASAWFHRHAFVLPDKQMLIARLQV